MEVLLCPKAKKPPTDHLLLWCANKGVFVPRIKRVLTEERAPGPPTNLVTTRRIFRVFFGCARPPGGLSLKALSKG